MMCEIRYTDIPDGLSEEAQDFHYENRLYGFITKGLVDELADFMRGRRVLEVYAGRGHLSALLQEKGIEVKATSLRQGHDSSSALGHVCEVEDLHVVEAVAKYRDWLDVLLVCWPTTDNGLFRSLDLLPAQTPIVFIGEVTDYTSIPHFLGGCATDEFFDAVVEIQNERLSNAYLSPRQDKLKVYMRRN